MNSNSNQDYSLNCDSSVDGASCFVFSPSVMSHKDDWAALQRLDVVVADTWPNSPFDLVFPFYAQTKVTGLHVGLATTQPQGNLYANYIGLNKVFRVVGSYLGDNPDVLKAFPWDEEYISNLGEF